MNVEAPTRVLVLGNAYAGKTTFLVQLHGRIAAGQGGLRARGAPSSLTAIEEGFKQLQQGVAVKHTAHGTDVTLALPAVTSDGDEVDIVVPDYAGEDLGRVVNDRRIPLRWRAEAAAADRWLLLIRLSKHAELPDVLSRPIGELAEAPEETPPVDGLTLPADMWAVELLQSLLYWREQDTAARGRPVDLTLVLSCWDELGETPPRPEMLAEQRLALLVNFCRARLGASRFRIVGMSAQGHELDDDRPAADYLDEGPQRMGWLVQADGTRDTDLTRLVACP